MARRSCDFPPKESDVISLQSFSDTENAKAENKRRSYGMEDEIVHDALSEEELKTLPSPVICFKFQVFLLL